MIGYNTVYKIASNKSAFANLGIEYTLWHIQHVYFLVTSTFYNHTIDLHLNPFCKNTYVTRNRKNSAFNCSSLSYFNGKTIFLHNSLRHTKISDINSPAMSFLFYHHRGSDINVSEEPAKDWLGCDFVSNTNVQSRHGAFLNLSPHHKISVLHLSKIVPS